MNAPSLAIENLSVAYPRPDDGGESLAVFGASLSLAPGSVLGLAGESGCGKSTLALAAIGYRAGGASVKEGRSLFAGADLLKLETKELRRLWGRRIAYVSQNAATALNPSIPVGQQLAEPLSFHLGVRGRDLRRQQIELFEKVGIADPERGLKRYPDQFSGGQQQRIAIAIALSCRPDVLIFDEPTTGLDVTTQARISALLRSLLDDSAAATLYVSHDLALLSTIADRLAVMYAGEVVEEGVTGEVIERPRHPYTRALLSSVPSAHERRGVAGLPGRPPSEAVRDYCSFVHRCAHARPACKSRHPVLENAGDGHRVRCLRWRDLGEHNLDPVPLPARTRSGASLLEVNAIRCRYPGVSAPAVADVSFSLTLGETTGIVGESGSGKSTLLRAVAGLHPLESGSIVFRGKPLEARARNRPRPLLGQVQLVFQDPESSLNPRHTVSDLIRRPLRMFRDDVAPADEHDVILGLLEDVRLPRDVLHRYATELSGGQKQRVALARAFAARPALLLCDEVTSSLDVSVQASILELVADLTARFNTAVLFVSHDLAVVRTIADNVLVMKDGEVCEKRETELLFAAPAHHYTRELLNAVPRLAAGRGPVRSR